jgi:DNA-binding Lrp family transcriptional regulator
MPVSYVLLNVEPGSEEQVLNEVRKVPNVKDCHRIYGLYDMIAKVEADSMDGLKEIITWKIRRLPGVRSTLTTIVIE